MNVERSFNINLLDFPARGDRRPRWLRSPAMWLIIAGLMAFAWLGTWGWYALRERNQKIEVARLQEKARLTAAEQGSQSEAAALRNALDLKEAEIRKIEALLVPSDEVLNQLETSIPSGMKLTVVTIGGDELSCKGVAADYPSLATFIRSAGQRENLSEVRCALSETTDEGIRFEVLLIISRK